MGVTENTLRHYFKAYHKGGVTALTELDFYRPQSELATHRERRETYFQEHPPASIYQASALIEHLTGLKRGPTQVRTFLKSVGLKRRKVAVVPAKAEADKQANFKKRVRTAP